MANNSNHNSNYNKKTTQRSCGLITGALGFVGINKRWFKSDLAYGESGTSLMILPLVRITPYKSLI